jgi:hypothetical protein
MSDLASTLFLPRVRDGLPLCVELHRCVLPADDGIIGQVDLDARRHDTNAHAAREPVTARCVFMM